MPELQHDSIIKAEQVEEHMGAFHEEGKSKSIFLPVLRVEGQIVNIQTEQKLHQTDNIVFIPDDDHGIYSSEIS